MRVLPGRAPRVSRAAALTMGLSLGLSAGIHAFVIDTHLREWWVAGLFFAGAAISQAVCAYTALRTRGSRHAMTVGAIASVLLLSVWAVSRTVGIPFGPSAGAPEALGSLDVIASIAEMVSVAAFLAPLVSARASVAPATRASRLAAAALVGLMFGAGTATAAAMPAHTHSHPPVAPAQHVPLERAKRGVESQPRADRSGAPQPHDHDRPHGH